MENKTINIDNIKIAIFDFDDTLAIHRDKNHLKRRYENEDNYILKNKGVKMYCVSGMKYSFHLKAKEHFVHKYYDENIEVFSAGTQELKCKAVKIIQRMNKCNLDEMLFIDDIEDFDYGPEWIYNDFVKRNLL